MMMMLLSLPERGECEPGLGNPHPPPPTPALYPHPPQQPGETVGEGSLLLEKLILGKTSPVSLSSLNLTATSCPDTIHQGI